jgi:hypothetical protein
LSDQHLRPGPSENALPVIAEPDVEAAGSCNPWERRAEVGWTRAFWRTCRVFLVRPVGGFGSTRLRGGFRGPLVFALIVSFVASFMAEFIDGLYQLAVSPAGSGNLGDILDVKLGGETLGGLEWLPESMLGAVSFAGCFFALLFGLPVFALMFPLVMLAWTGLLHLCLKLAGGLRDSQAGYQGTWAAVCYSTVAFLPGMVPVVGDWVAFLWLGLLQGIGFWKLHHTTPRRAVVALLLPLSIPAGLWLLHEFGVITIEASSRL